MYNNFNYYLPVNIHFGAGRVVELPQHVAAYGTKALIVTGRSSTKKSGLLDRITGMLEDASIGFKVFDEVESNPLSTTAQRGADLALAECCDVIVAVGGGSIMDCAKHIAFRCLNPEGEIFDYIWGTRTGSKALPLIAIPTTCGTGSDGNGTAVLTDPVTHDKKSLTNSCLVPKVSILDPELYKTMPKQIFASVVFDALCHCMESYVNRNANVFSDMLSLSGIELIGKYFTKVYNDYDYNEGWEGLVMASVVGGMTLNAAGGGAPHAIEHPASGLRNITHGEGLAAVSPWIYELQLPHAREKFAKISVLLGGSGADDFVATLRKLIAAVHLDRGLAQQGVQEGDIDWMAENCLHIMSGVIKTSPTPNLTADDIKEIYRKAL